MRNVLLVLAAFALVGCASGPVRNHATSADGAAGAALGAPLAAHGASSTAPKAVRSTLSRGTLAAVNADYRGTGEPAPLRPCKIQITSEMQRQMNGSSSMSGRPQMKLKEISVPCSTRCPGEMANAPTKMNGPRPGN